MVSSLHNCTSKSLCVLIAAEEEGVDYGGGRANTEDAVVEGEQLDDPKFQTIKLSPLAARGFDSPRTMKLVARIDQSLVRVMVDSGACHYFISEEIAKKLQLSVDTSMTRRLGDGRGLIV